MPPNAPARRRPMLQRVRERERRYPIWSARSLVLVMLAALAVTLPSVLLLNSGRMMVRLEITLSMVAAGLFLFLAIGLYRGARVRKSENVAGELQTVGMPDSLPSIDGGFDLGSSDDGCLGMIFGLLAILFLVIVVFVLAILAINAGLILVFLFMLMTGWLFHRALRQVFARSRRCRGDFAASLTYAGGYTFLYTGWLFALLMIADWFMRRNAL